MFINNTNKNNFAEIIDEMNKSYKINDKELAFALYYELYNRLATEGYFRFGFDEYLLPMTIAFQVLIDRVNRYKNKNCGAVQLIKTYVTTLKKHTGLPQENIAILDNFVANIQEIKNNIILHDDYQTIKSAHISKKAKMEVLKQLYTYLTNVRNGLSNTTNKAYLTIIMEEIETTISSKLEEYIAIFNYDNTISIEDYLKEDVKNVLMDYYSDISLFEELNKLNIQVKKDELEFFNLLYVYYISGYLKNNPSRSDLNKTIKEVSDNLNISKLQILRLSSKLLLTMLKGLNNSFIDLFRDDAPTDNITR